MTAPKNQNDADHEDLDLDESAKDSKSSEFAKLLEASFKAPQRKLAVGDKIRGEVLVVGREEVFVSTGAAGITRDGIVFKRDLLNAEGQCTHQVGDVLDLYVIQFKGGDIYLSPKQSSKSRAKELANDLEDAFDMMLPVSGTVAEVCKGGVRVNIQGKLAFCPISQLDLVRVETGEEYIGKKFDFRITQFTESGRNIVVSRRKILEEERELNGGGFADERKPGDIVTGTVKKIEPFGAFVEVSPGVEGLLHISELSWSRVADPKEVVSVGQVIQVKVLKSEHKDGRLKISLSLKQAGEGPWDLVSKKFPVGTIVTGKVERREPYGLFVKIEENITGLLPKSKAQESPEFSYDKFKIGDAITIQIAELRVEERRISLQVPLDPNRDDWKGYATGSSGSFGTLGDKLKGALVKKKG